MNAWLSLGLFLFAVVSGMLGLGVAFAAVPFLSLFLPDLVHQVQPLSLLLNGVTALFAVVGFAQSGYVDWRKALALALVTPAFAPRGGVARATGPGGVGVVGLPGGGGVPGLQPLPSRQGQG